MKILMVTPFFYEPPQAKIGTLRLCVELSKRGNHVYVLSSRILGTPKFEEIKGIKVFRQEVIYLPYIPYVIPVEINLIDKIIETYKIDVIHAHTVEFVSSYFAFKEAKKWKKPFVISIHGMKRTTGRKIVDVASDVFDHMVSRKIVKNADAIIALSNELALRAVELGASLDKVKVIPNGIDLEVATNPRRLSRREFSLSYDDFVVGFVGRLYPIKGVNYLVRAGKSLIDEIPNLKIVIVGDGPLRGALMKETESVRDRFIFTGYVEEARRFFPLFDLFVLPSLSEGLSTTLLEALSCGVPSIVTSVGAAKDIIQNGFNGVLIPPKDSEAISESIRRVYKDDGLRAWIGANAKKTIRDSYVWNKIVPKIEDLYQELLVGTSSQELF